MSPICQYVAIRIDNTLCRVTATWYSSRPTIGQVVEQRKGRSFFLMSPIARSRV
jgi:hypothetical protein